MRTTLAPLGFFPALVLLGCAAPETVTAWRAQAGVQFAGEAKETSLGLGATPRRYDQAGWGAGVQVGIPSTSMSAGLDLLSRCWETKNTGESLSAEFLRARLNFHLFWADGLSGLWGFGVGTELASRTDPSSGARATNLVELLIALHYEIDERWGIGLEGAGGAFDVDGNGPIDGGSYDALSVLVSYDF